MSATFSDRELLYGILAVQMGLVEREALVEGIRARTAGEEGLLGDILLQRQAFSLETKELVDALVEQHLALHDNDTARSLASLSTIGSLGDELKTLGVSELDAGLEHLTIPAVTVPTDGASAKVSPAVSSEGGRFRVLRMHAKGGIGQVSLAVDGQLSREVALKELQPRYADDPSSRHRFILEAEVTGGLEHPGVVPVYGAGQYADGRPFYAMRFIRGDSLQDASAEFHRRMAKDPKHAGYELELRKLLRRFIDVCEAMEYAHSRGVLHRDLKPGNIMLGRYGETLVVDWGMAKVAKGDSSSEVASGEAILQPASADESAATRMGSTIGTPNYMSPEQAAGDVAHLGAASDIYSLGATLYYVLTGQPPFRGDDVEAILDAVQFGAFRRPREVNPHISRSLEAICLKAMAHAPENRYLSAQALADDVERHLADEPIQARPDSPWQSVQRWTRRHRGATLAGAAALVLVTVVSAIAFFAVSKERDEAQRQRDRAVASEQDAQQNARAAQAARAQAEEQERLAARIAYNSTLSEASRLLGSDPMMARSLLEDQQRCPPERRDLLWHVMHNQTVREAHAIPLESAETELLAYSPQGDILATASSNSGDVQLWDTSTGKLAGMLKTGLPGILEVQFSPDGSQLAAINERGIIENIQPVAKLSVYQLEVWDQANHRLLDEWQREMPSGMALIFDEKGLKFEGILPEWRYAELHPEYQVTSGAEFVVRPQRWFQWTICDVAANTEQVRYLRPAEGTTLLGGFDTSRTAVAAMCSTDSVAYYWMYDFPRQRETALPISDATNVEALGVLADDDVVSYLGMSYDEELIPEIDSLALLGSLEWDGDMLLRQFDLKTQEEKRKVALGQFHTGARIEERFQLGALDRAGDRLAMLIDLRPLIQVVDLERPDSVYMIPAHLGDVVSVAMSPDGSQLASVGLDRKLRLWDFQQVTSSGAPVVPQVVRPHRLVVSHVDDQVLLLGLGPRPDYSSQGDPIEPNFAVPDENLTENSAAEVQPEDQRLYFQMESFRASDAASLSLSEYQEPEERRGKQPEGFAGVFGAIGLGIANALAESLGTHPIIAKEQDVKLSADATQLLIASTDRLMRFDLETGAAEEIWNSSYPDFQEPEPLQNISVSDDLQLFVTLTQDDGKLRVYDLPTKQVVWQLPAEAHRARYARFLPASNLILVLRELAVSDEVQPYVPVRGEIWDVESRQRRQFEMPAINNSDLLTFSTDGKLLVVHRQFDRRVWVVEVATGKMVSQLNIVRETPLGMLPGSDLLMLAGDKGQLSFWDVRINQYRAELQVLEDEIVSDVALSADGNTLVVLGNRASLRFLGVDRLRDNLADVQELLVLKRGESTTESADETDTTQPSGPNQPSGGEESPQLPHIEILDEMPVLGTPKPPVDESTPAEPYLIPAPVVDPSA